MVKTAFNQAVQSIHRHPKRLAAAVAAALLSMGGGAFALASIESNSKDVVVREILENLALPETQQTFAALPVTPLTLFRTTTTRANDTADTLLKRLGVFDVAAAAYLRSNKELHQSLLVRTGRLVSVEANGSRGLQKLTARWINKDADDSFQRLVIEKTEVGFVSRIVSAPLVATQALGSATISSSLFAATDEAGIPDAVAVQLAEIFSGQVDFRRSLRKGDRLSVVYEALQADGETMRSGKVLSAEFVNNGQIKPSGVVSRCKQQQRPVLHTLTAKACAKHFWRRLWNLPACLAVTAFVSTQSRTTNAHTKALTTLHLLAHLFALWVMAWLNSPVRSAATVM